MSWHKEIFETSDFIKDFYSFWSKESKFKTYGIMKSRQINLLKAIDIFIYGKPNITEDFLTMEEI